MLSVGLSLSPAVVLSWWQPKVLTIGGGAICGKARRRNHISSQKHRDAIWCAATGHALPVWSECHHSALRGRLSAWAAATYMNTAACAYCQSQHCQLCATKQRRCTTHGNWVGSSSSSGALSGSGSRSDPCIASSTVSPLGDATLHQPRPRTRTWTCNAMQCHAMPCQRTFAHDQHVSALGRDSAGQASQTQHDVPHLTVRRHHSLLDLDLLTCAPPCVRLTGICTAPGRGSPGFRALCSAGRPAVPWVSAPRGGAGWSLAGLRTRKREPTSYMCSCCRCR
jgi:hypothetical protein